jgi:hypothetical protein
MFKKIMKFISVAVLFVIVYMLHTAVVYAKVVPNCRGELREVFAEEKKYIKDIFVTGKGWHLKYNVNSTVYNKQTLKYENHDSNGEIIAGAHVRYKKTANNEVFVDDHDIYTISNRNKTILHTFSKPNALSVKDDAYSEILQDSLFNMMSVTDCNKLTVGNREVICYNLKSDQRRCPYSKITIFTDPSTKYIIRVIVVMNLIYQKEVKEYSFTILEKNEVAIDPSWEHLSGKFLNTSGKLKAPYNLYTIEEPAVYAKKNAAGLKAKKSLSKK